jgi:hypothetical protein
LENWAPAGFSCCFSRVYDKKTYGIEVKRHGIEVKCEKNLWDRGKFWVFQQFSLDSTGNGA